MLNLKTRPIFNVFKLARKAKFFKHPIYQAIPHYMVPELMDPHDEYQLRSKEEIFNQLQNQPPNFQVTVETTTYPGNQQFHVDYNRRIKIKVDMKQMNLTPLQKFRLVTLLGPRYKNDDVLKLCVDMYDTPEKNIEKGLEQLKELYFEAIRAP